MTQERCEHTLQATALVNEAYLRLVNSKSPLNWESRGQFAAAAKAKRCILVEHARARLRQKRGGDRSREELPTELGDYRLSPTQMLDFDEAIERLAALDPAKAEVVKLRCETTRPRTPKWIPIPAGRTRSL
jgi:RNA polymerase sigma factor (TIGR02999 family)